MDYDYLPLSLTTLCIKDLLAGELITHVSTLKKEPWEHVRLHSGARGQQTGYPPSQLPFLTFLFTLSGFRPLRANMRADIMTDDNKLEQVSP